MSAWRGIVGKKFSPAEFEGYVEGLKFDAWRPSFAVLHNTGVPTLAKWHDYPGAVRMRGLTHYYRDEKKWPAGPHLFIPDDGIWVFTPPNVPGVHSPSWNHVSWGIEMVGDFDVEAFSAKVRDNAISALATLYARLGLQSSTLRFHKEDPKTTHKRCPGHHVDKQVIVGLLHDELWRRHAGEHVPDRPDPKEKA